MASAQDRPTDEDETITPENLVKSKKRSDHAPLLVELDLQDL
jgi:hypothetical protein